MVEMLGPFGKGLRQVGLNKGIGYIHNDNLLSLCSIDGGSKDSGLQNGGWDESSNIEFSQQGCLDIGITMKKVRPRCTPEFDREEVQLVQGLKGIAKVQLSELSED